MKQLYYVRHGESFSNVYDRFSTKAGTANDLPLTPKGQQQVNNGVTALLAAGPKIDVIVCSPILRARETADMFADALHYPKNEIIITELVQELQFGALEGTPWKAWWDADNTYEKLGEVPGAETIEVLQQRAEKALAYLQTLPEDNVLVVAHGAFGRALKRVIDGRPYTDEFPHGTPLPHGEVLRFI